MNPDAFIRLARFFYAELQKDSYADLNLILETLNRFEQVLPHRTNVDGYRVPYFNGFFSLNLGRVFSWKGFDAGMKEFYELIDMYEVWHDMAKKDSTVDVLAY